MSVSSAEKQAMLGPFGPFELHSLINSGGMADIYLASDAEGNYYSLRRLHSSGRFDFTGKRRFMSGCEALSRIAGHPNIIGYFEHGKIQGEPYLLMEFVEGDNLKMLSARGDTVVTDNIGTILIEMAEGLEHMHDQGFAHLDFKPENVLLADNATVRIVDFDMAIPLKDAPVKLSKNPGTPAYMAPEQLRRKGLDHRTDHFAFGVTAYELLTGEKPFNGDPKEILRCQVMQDKELTPPRAHNPDIPAKVEQIILKCLKPDMAERYPFSSVLTRDLKAALYV